MFSDSQCKQVQEALWSWLSFKSEKNFVFIIYLLDLLVYARFYFYVLYLFYIKVSSLKYYDCV